MKFVMWSFVDFFPAMKYLLSEFLFLAISQNEMALHFYVVLQTVCKRMQFEFSMLFSLHMTKSEMRKLGLVRISRQK